MNKRPVYYKQSDPKWGKIPYTIDGDKKETIGASGCGPTSAAMIIASVKDAKITPVEMCKLAIELKDRTANSGTEWEFFGKVAAKYGIPFKQSGSTKDAIEALKIGAYVVCSMKPGKFTKGGHYILAWDFKDNDIIVHDPASALQSRTFGDIKTFETECKQYFIFFVNQKIDMPKLPVLKRGMNNQYVKTLQELLNKFGYKLTVDGDFGAKTEDAIRDFQRKRGLIDDGVVGQKTLDKLYGV
ncbi:MAG: hypothetical protein K0R80_2905 [Clostridia bacterium]|jgi:hypothetical protein|nr:hypothetical protein [Clostridia bacterium]